MTLCNDGLTTCSQESFASDFGRTNFQVREGRLPRLLGMLLRDEITGRHSPSLSGKRPNGWNHRPRAPSSGTPALSKN